MRLGSRCIVLLPTHSINDVSIFIMDIIYWVSSAQSILCELVQPAKIMMFGPTTINKYSLLFITYYHKIVPVRKLDVIRT